MELLGTLPTPRQLVMALACPLVPLGGMLIQEATKAAPIPQAKRSKVVAAALVRSSSRSRGAKANLPTL